MTVCGDERGFRVAWVGVGYRQHDAQADSLI